MSSTKMRAVAAAAVVCALGLPLAGQATAGPADIPGTAGAQTITGTPEPARPAFYEPPASIPSTPGTIIRSEPAPLLLDPFGLSSSLVTATRIMYSSTDGDGIPIAVTGTVFVPKAQYIGVSKRPLISYAPGTQGLGDRCAPSRQMESFVEYEGVGISRTVGRGYAVGVTDFQGLGTPGTHTYMAREPQGRATLDMARAAKNLQGSGLDDTNPIGLMGYSQGGGAAAAAAELASSYAPELNIKGSAIGAPPADLAKVGANIDGTTYTLFALFAMLGVATSEHIDVAPYLNDAGKQLAGQVEDACVLDLFEYANLDTSKYTKSGKDLTSLLSEEPFRSAVANQKIGKIKPNAPVQINHAIGDDVIPYAVGKKLGSDWCDKGTRVTFNAGLIPTHVGGFVPHVEKSMWFFEARFAGHNQVNSCWLL
ncbi:lipase [Janibacter sp. Soil728]|uniref:lipase family protein n=1 Tax=Janibacter sp. Soil728 TaxID=1736393 RepID=UPI0006FEC4E0|nr:lipase family protein [Janibacter sp. Soil728]KRE37645.1 lipase [Janibacter sp. Soil728]